MIRLARAVVLIGAICLLLCGGCEHSGPGWPEITYDLELLPIPPTESHVRDTFFVNERLGFLVSIKGEILRTRDGGHSWEMLESGTDIELSAVLFLNDKTGFVVGGCSGSICGGSRGIILQTEDGGDSWSSTVFPGVFDLYGLAFATPEIGVVVGSRHTARTTDGGRTWELSEFPDANLHDVEFFDANRGVACGGYSGESVLFLTDDAGETWRRPDAPSAFSYLDVDIAGDQALVVGQSKVIMSVDRGETWVELPGRREMFAVHIIDPMTFFGVTRASAYRGYATTYFTQDAGVTWDVDIEAGKRDGGSSAYAFFGLSFPTPETGYAGGNRGYMAKISLFGLRHSAR